MCKRLSRILRARCNEMASDQTTSRKVAAFFDVDGTLVNATIVHYYVFFRRKRMSPLLGRLWYAGYLVKCIYYLLLDKIDRGRLNIAFYRDYAGLPVEEIKGRVAQCDAELIQPRQFVQAAACVAEHKSAGRTTVLVTGSVDFIMAPLARRLGVDTVEAATLVEKNGRFTGQLAGPPVGNDEKARRVLAFASEHEIDLRQSYAYGDSIADLPMLEAVGHPQVVNPDRALAAAARSRGWPVHAWHTANGSA